jgi:hypothetical protein
MATAKKNPKKKDATNGAFRKPLDNVYFADFRRRTKHIDNIFRVQVTDRSIQGSAHFGTASEKKHALDVD